MADGVSLERNLGGVLKTMATTSSALGEAFRSLAVWFFMWTLVIMSSTRWIEALFAGLDRAAIWHRGVAILGTVSLALHALFTEIGKETTLGKPLATLGGQSASSGSWCGRCYRGGGTFYLDSPTRPWRNSPQGRSGSQWIHSFPAVEGFLAAGVAASNIHFEYFNWG